MIEDTNEIGLSNVGVESTRDNISPTEASYINECVEGGSPSTLIDRIDELSTCQPPKGIDSNSEIAEIIEPVKDKIDNKYLEAPSDVEQVEQISDCLSDMENLDFDNWCNLSTAEREETLQNVEDKISNIEHREPCQIKYRDMEDGYFGYYSPEDKTITLNTRYVEANDFNSYKETLDTIVHEGRHAYQDYNMNEREVHPRGGEVNMWRWNEEECGYKSCDLYGYEMYAMQPVESDARAFAEDVLTSYFEKKG